MNMRSRSRAWALNACSPATWLAGVFGLFYFSYGIYLPYWSLWLDGVGVSAHHIGLLLGASMLARTVGNLWVMSQVRSALHLQPALRILACISLFSGLAFYWADSGLYLWLLMLLLNFFYPALIPLNDTLASRYIVQVRLDYGRARLWGSLAFIVANILVGQVSAHYGVDWILHLWLLGLLGLSLMSLVPVSPKPMSGADEPKGEGLSTVWRRAGMPSFLLIVALLQGSHAFYYGFSALYWQQQGYATSTVGYLWGLGVLAEILVLACNKRWFSHLSARYLLLLGAGCALVRWGILGATTELGWLIAAQLLHAGSFCFSHLGAIRYISRDLAPHAAAGAQALYAALAMGLMVALLLALSGYLYPVWAGRVFWLMAALVLPVFWVLRKPLTPAPSFT